jgi:hypothetical protein
MAKLTTASAQGPSFMQSAPLSFSTIAGPWLRHQRLELETDLIAACVLADRRPPPTQFIGYVRQLPVMISFIGRKH